MLWEQEISQVQILSPGPDERDPVFELFYRKRGRVFLKTVAGVGKFESSKNQAIIKTLHFRKLIFDGKHSFWTTVFHKKQSPIVTHILFLMAEFQKPRVTSLCWYLFKKSNENMLTSEYVSNHLL